MARGSSNGQGPEFLRFPAAADELAAEIADYADAQEKAAADAGQGRVHATRVQRLRRYAAQIAACGSGEGLALDGTTAAPYGAGMVTRSEVGGGE